MTFDEFEEWFRARYHRTSSALTSTAFIFSDLAGLMFAFGWGFFTVNLYDLSIINFKSFVTYWSYLPVFILIYQIMNLYPGLSLAPSEEFRRFTVGSFMAYGGIILSRYIEDRDWDAISAAFMVSAFFSPLILLTMRSAVFRLLHKSRIWGVPAVIYGSGSTGRMLIDRLLVSVRTGYKPALILDDEPGGLDTYRGIPIFHDTMLGPEIARRFHIKMAIVAMPKLEPLELKKLLNDSVSAFRYNVLIPDFFHSTNIWMAVRDFDGILGFVTSHKLKMFWNLGIKRFLDITVVLTGGIILSPMLLCIALLVKLSSPGPVLYGHKRLGLNGRPFTAYKFRSMVKDSTERLEKLLASDAGAREEWEANRKLRNDPRITKIGRFLRRGSFDEFPQFINILKGEMSLVGPRPIVQDEVKKYGEEFRRIFSVKPGLTGLWQVSGRSDTDYLERVSYDTYYLQSWSVWLDLWIVYRTIGTIIKGKGAY
ncbi:MAG: undecaprenyl-phosphate galactose phosphotransferase WbaP [Treponema sp.]|jgi:Undecaprenyl-phosphate galactose phosphotransferase WbaP|nr:undecaprenyl-phosphate galactose phosphotransferase WbaP [Treponema sp.]